MVETSGDKGTLKAIDDDNIEITMHDGIAVPYDELEHMYPDFDIVEDDGINVKLKRK